MRLREIQKQEDYIMKRTELAIAEKHREADNDYEDQGQIVIADSNVQNQLIQSRNPIINNKEGMHLDVNKY